MIHSIKEDDSVALWPYQERIMVDGTGNVWHQYPLQLGWPVTIHKTQRMTQNAISIQRSGIFKPGTGYVALSRVTSLNGLYFQDLNTNLI